MIGSQDLIIGLAIAALLFGAKKLPELGASLGKSIREFRKATEGGTDAGAAPTPTPPAVAAPGPRACASCQTPLEAGWAHCPRCGVAAAPGIPTPR